MFKHRLIIIFLTGAFSFFSEGKDFIYLIGGGGESTEKPDTIFDLSISEVSGLYRGIKDKKELQVYFNGGHKKTEATLKSKLPKSSIKGDFTKKNFESMVQDLLKKLSSTPPDIAPGSKLVIFIDTHGQIKEEGMISHTVSTSDEVMLDYETGSPGNQANLDLLKKVTDLAKDKGVRMAIIDGSCHSGNALNLANSHTCVISASSRNQFATSFITDFTKCLRETKANMEACYLKGRSKDSGAAFPLISSPVGLKLEKEFEALFPLLYYRDPDNDGRLDKSSPYISTIFIDENLLCRRAKADAEFENFLDTLMKILPSLSKKTNNAYFSLYQKYKQKKAIYDELIEKLKALNLKKGEFVEKQDFFTVTGEKISYSPREIYEMNFGPILASELQALQSAQNESERTDRQAKISLLNSLAKIKQSMLVESKYKSYLSIMDELHNKEELYEELSNEIGNEASVVYEALYKKYTKESSESNACKDFYL